MTQKNQSTFQLKFASHLKNGKKTNEKHSKGNYKKKFNSIIEMSFDVFYIS
jgi:hypothetical protein